MSGVTAPFGFFDPMGLTPETNEELQLYREAELAHGRVAMVAALGFLVQVLSSTSPSPSPSALSPQPSALSPQPSPSATRSCNPNPHPNPNPDPKSNTDRRSPSTRSSPTSAARPSVSWT